MVRWSGWTSSWERDHRLEPCVSTRPPPAPPRTPPTPDPVPGSQTPRTGEAPAAAITVNKVIAGAGAAATSAVFGSYFGATGTVTGAALGSVASTVASAVYQRSLDRTRDRLVASVRIGDRTRDGATVLASESATEVTIPMPRVSPEQATTRLRVEPDVRPPRRRWILVSVLVTGLVFALGLLAVTGVEWAKGSSITTGQSGTSVGRVLQGGGGGTADESDKADRDATGATATPDRSADPTPDPSARPTATDQPNAGSTAEQAPTSEPESGQESEPASPARGPPRSPARSPRSRPRAPTSRTAASRARATSPPARARAAARPADRPLVSRGGRAARRLRRAGPRPR